MSDGAAWWSHQMVNCADIAHETYGMDNQRRESGQWDDNAQKDMAQRHRIGMGPTDNVRQSGLVATPNSQMCRYCT